MSARLGTDRDAQRVDCRNQDASAIYGFTGSSDKTELGFRVVRDHHPPGQYRQQLAKGRFEAATGLALIVGDAVDCRRLSAHFATQLNDAMTGRSEVDPLAVHAHPAEADDFIARRVAAGRLQIERQAGKRVGRRFRRGKWCRQVIAQRSGWCSGEQAPTSEIATEESLKTFKNH